MRGQYQPIEMTGQGWMCREQPQLFLGVHEETLRFFDVDEVLVPTPNEAAVAAQQHSAKLAEKLRELGVNPDEL